MRFAGRFAFAFGGEEATFIASTFDNLGFETAGATPGTALHWSLDAIDTVVVEFVAAWGATPIDLEGFEQEWNNDGYKFAFVDGDIVAPLFDTDVSEGEGKEDFEEGWSGNEHYLFAASSEEQASFDTGLTPEPVEDFEEGWSSNESYDFTLPSTTAASFDVAIASQAFEDFEDGWRGTGAGNDYLTTLSSSTAASFDAGGTPEAFEDFEETYQDLQVTVAPATDLFTAGSNHGLSAGNKVTFRLIGAGALPAGINAAFVYYVIASGLTTTQFKVSVASGGSAVDVTDAGVGTFYVRGDATAFWRLDP
jgi:hypothetical protein